MARASLMLTWTMFFCALQISVVSADSCKPKSAQGCSRATCSTAHQGPLLEESIITHHPGHWPSSYCKITNVYLNSAERAFYIGTKDLASIDVCFGTRNMWPIRSKGHVAERTSSRKCDQVFQTGHVFAVYYYHGSNYFHLHYDAAIPMYYSFHHVVKEGLYTPKNTVFMPSVEVRRGQGTNWDTDAFMDDASYWNVLLQLVVQPYRLLPLDLKLVAMNKTFCFHQIYFGTPRYDVTEPGLLSDFASSIKSNLHLHFQGADYRHGLRKVGFIHRVGRRRILNERQLLSAISPLVDAELIDFAGLSFPKQVEAVQKFDILIGMNGAGLVNAIYLPTNSVAIQLIPYQAQLNFEEYKRLLSARGHYLEWRNVHANLSKSSSPHDSFNNNVDTYVHVEEFVSLIKNALKLF